MGRVLKFEYYCNDKLCTKVLVNYEKQAVAVENFTDDVVSQAFGKRTVGIDDIDDFFRDRVFPESRVNCGELLERLGLTNFDAEAIARKTHGILGEDVYWLRFDDENFGWEDVCKIRQFM